MTRVRIGTILALVGALLVISLASAQGTDDVQVTLSDFKVELSNTSLPARTPIKFVVTNKGPSAHELVLERTGHIDEPLEIDSKALEIEPDELSPGATVTVVWTIPEAGSYQFACHVPGHYEAGMVTLFTATVAPGELPRTGGADRWWLFAPGLLAFVALGAGLALRNRRLL
jgi:uncharacterized cupredoxin-like copper-binding protein